MDSTENIMRGIARRKSARKAARTRAANRAMLKRWREVEEPASRRMDVLLNHLLLNCGCGEILLRWNPLNNNAYRLKHGVQVGRLVKLLHGGRTLRVKPDGYRRAKDFHPSFWEFVERRN